MPYTVVSSGPLPNVRLSFRGPPSGIPVSTVVPEEPPYSALYPVARLDDDDALAKPLFVGSYLAQ
jgi:hypothetical protein